MKKTVAIAIVLVLTLMLDGSVLAETTAEAPVNTETPSEEVEVIEEKNGFLVWIGQSMDKVSDTLSEGWNKATDAVEAGWNKASEAVTSGIDWLGDKIAAWASEAEAYMQKKQWDKKVQDAWETLKTGAQQKGKIAGEALTEAYHTVRDWLVQADESVDQNVAEAVDNIAEAAGVAEAKFSSWYRKVEEYLTEKADLVTESTRNAWALIKQNAVQAGSIAKDKLTEAYAQLREWLLEMGEPADSEMMTVLEDLEEESLS